MEHVGVHLHVAKIIEASFFPLDELNGWCKAHVSCDMLAFEPLNKQMEIQVKPKLYILEFEQEPMEHHTY